jgi:trehalose/maltose hydrolase-like predicted phosphorylase
VSLPTELDRRFEAVVFDWDGTAVPDRGADASGVRSRVERLSAAGMDLVVVSGTHVANVDGQLAARPRGPGHLLLCLNRGSEAFTVEAAGPRLLWRREATPAEDEALTAAAQLAVAQFGQRGLRVELVSARLNRRKLDLIPEPEWADPPKARIGELVEAVEERLRRAGIAGLDEAVRVGLDAAREAGLAEARVTSDAKHVEIGLTDKSDAARLAFRELWLRGIGPGLVLVAGDELGPLGGVPGSDSLLLLPEAEGLTAVSVGPEPAGVPPGVVHLGGGPDAFAALLDDQLRRREERNVPAVNADPRWSLALAGPDPELERVHEALLTIADGFLGTSGSPLAYYGHATPLVLAAGVYTGEGPETALLPAPIWSLLPYELREGDRLRRVLDLRAGLLRQELTTPAGRLTSLQLSSLARPGTVALRADGPPALVAPVDALVPPGGVEAGRERRDAVEIVHAGAPDGVVAAGRDALLDTSGGRRSLERLAAFVRGADSGAAAAALERAVEAGFERLLVEHRRAWGDRWEEADVEIDGDPELQLAVRFALYHLMSSVGDEGEAALGSRGLSGPAYRGHVFWDTDVFVLPFLAATHPAAARALLQYRVARLPAARAAAAAGGYRGARFPWESAAEGVDVTPPEARSATGERVPILTGLEEEHIVADVAWASACYADWSGDGEFAEGPGRLLLIETARYWTSRIRVDGEGRGHIDRVIGPDEYHVHVDDNAFTNVMARWNLRRAVQAVGTDAEGVESGEAEEWLRLAEVLADGYDPSTGLYEQFAGFFELEPLVIAELAARRPVAAEALLGRERVEAAQVVKQADVLMLHHLVPDEVAAGSLRPNLLFYEPRTAHGSSLSPGVHASLLARAGRLPEAVDALRLASRIDLDDLTGTTAGGLHLATMGGVWQALAFGFAGLRPRGAVLELDPRLPPEWPRLELRIRFRGSRVVVRIDGEGSTVTADPPVGVRLPGRDPVEAGPEGARLTP